ncbi:hypothetical protein DFS34DRAFT_636716 [Phlyctochytrium arcticum]|nr:hypothetical protein DFS34DRAFT_636716 [Phlyctochytrium arcticum]
MTCHPPAPRARILLLFALRWGGFSCTRDSFGIVASRYIAKSREDHGTILANCRSYSSVVIPSLPIEEPFVLPFACTLWV